MLNLGNTLYLIAAVGILVPLLIHLWNRKPLRIMAVGSIRWLKGSSTHSSRSLQLKEWPLLLLRCLMLLLFSILLAGLFWERSPGERAVKANYYLIHWQILPQLSRSAIDSLEIKGWELRILAPGMPPLADSLEWQGQSVDIWAVMREADNNSGIADTVRLRTPLLQSAFSGERPALHKHYIFTGANGEAEEKMPLETTLVDARAFQLGTQVFLQQAISDGESIKIRNDTLATDEWSRLAQNREIKLSPPDTLKVSMLGDVAYKRDREILGYAMEAALGNEPSIRLLLNTAMEEAPGSDVLVWFGNNTVPDSLLVLPEKNPLLIQVGNLSLKGADWLLEDFHHPDKSVFRLTERPLPEKVSREKLSRLPLELARLLGSSKQERLSGHLPMPEGQALPLKAGASAEIQATMTEREDLHIWVWLLLFGLFVTERLWVYLK